MKNLWRWHWGILDEFVSMGLQQWRRRRMGRAPPLSTLIVFVVIRLFLITTILLFLWRTHSPFSRSLLSFTYLSSLVSSVTMPSLGLLWASFLSHFTTLFQLFRSFHHPSLLWACRVCRLSEVQGMRSQEGGCGSGRYTLWWREREVKRDEGLIWNDLKESEGGDVEEKKRRREKEGEWKAGGV